MEFWSIGIVTLQPLHHSTTPSAIKPRVPLVFAAGLGHSAYVNTASQDLPHHLGVLRERMLHPTDYELAVNYFLEEFAGDAKFVQQSERDDAPHLLAVLTHVASQAIGRRVAFDDSKVFLLGPHRFYHGNAAVEGRVVLFFYFQEADTGIAALIPGVRGAMEVARFRLTAGLPDPRKN